MALPVEDIHVDLRLPLFYSFAVTQCSVNERKNKVQEQNCCEHVPPKVRSVDRSAQLLERFAFLCVVEEHIITRLRRVVKV